MGGKALSQWLMAVAIADVTPSACSEDIALRCVLRGKFLELLALRYPKESLSPESMFLLGLFSSLDKLLGLICRRLLREMPLEKFRQKCAAVQNRAN